MARLDGPAIEGGLFHDIEIVPAQIYPGSRDAAQAEPIRKLMTAILVDAVQCYRGTTADRERNRSAGGQLWIFGSYTESPFSFINVCTELGLSPDHIRLQLRDRDRQAEAVHHAEERGIHLWIQSVTPLQQQRRIVGFRLFVNGLSILGAAALF